MKFVQRSAGNAQTERTPRPGAAWSPVSHRMTHRLTLIPALVLALALPVASAQASDPLLSGYAGPGGGEQVVLGSDTAGSGSGSSSSSSRADAPLKATATTPAPAAAAASPSSSGTSSDTPALTSRPQRKKSSSSASQDTGDDPPTQTTTTQTTTTAAPVGAPERVAYPTRAGEVSGLPVAPGGLLLVVLGVAAAVLVGLGLRRLSYADNDPERPQGPAL
jgi:hypothetical protein